MNSFDRVSAGKNSSLLLSAAIAGLLGGGAVSCSKGDDDSPKAPETASASAQITLTRIDHGVTLKSFESDCEDRGGFVQTHATCGGTNSCKGVSYNKFDHSLNEHSCRAINTCGGMSCVELPKDLGLTAEAIYADNCRSCHGVVDEASGARDDSLFKLYIAPSVDAEAAEKEFLATSLAVQQTKVAFGTHGVNPDGSAFSNMPAFYEKLSRPAIERVVTYLRTLKAKAETYSLGSEP